ncbi:DedA family protein [Ectobacillus polymachus]|uniref:DedA family protein n=1 Tax=Ectobacillus polymachus TaxID=1508806 RepID=UPI003A8B13B6
MLSGFVNHMLDFFISMGYFGIALALMIEIIPSEIVLAYAGFLVLNGQVNFVEAVIAGVIGGTIAQLFLYWIGYYGGRPFVEKYGKYIFISKHHLEVAENWFNKYGVGVIFSARFIPVVRHAISIPAGLAKMSFWKFTTYTVLAIIPWSILFISLGEKLGANWRDIKEYAKPFTPYIVAGAILFIVLYFGLKMFKKKKNA